MRSPGKTILCSLALLFCLDAGRLSAQDATPQQASCFSVYVSLNGKPVNGPREIKLKAKQSETKSPLQQGCFRVPAALLTEKTLGISFTIPGNKIDIPTIATGFFSGSWDVELEDKKFGNAVALPKHFRAKQGCVIVFHMGDEPERGLSVMPCRTPLPSANK